MGRTYPAFPDAKKVKWLDSVLLLAVVIGLKLPIIDTPFYWDEMGAYIEPAHWLAQGSLIRVMPGFHPVGKFFGHPPLLYTVVTLFFKLFNGFLRPAHAIAIGFAFLGCYFTYRLGSLFYGRLTGLTAALILFFMPLYFAQAGMFLGDLPIAAVGVMTIYFFVTGRYCAYLIAGCCLVMIKETGMALIAAVAVYQGLSVSDRRRTLVEILRYAVPFLPILIFFIAQKAETGNFISNPYFQDHAFTHFSLFSAILKGGFVFYWIFFAQGRFLLTGLICAGLLWRRISLARRELLLFGLIVAFFSVPFSFIYFIPRYCLPVLPFVAIAGSAALFALAREEKVAFIATCFLILFSPFMPDRKPAYTNFENDLQYLEVVKLYRQGGDYLERYYLKSTVYTPWPLDTAFSKPYLGYVALPLNIVGNPVDAKIVLISTLDTKAEQEQLRRVILRYNFRLLKIFERSGKTLSLYYRD